MSGLSFLGPDGCALVRHWDYDGTAWVYPLKIVAGPDYWEARAAAKRRVWADAERCRLCGDTRFDCCTHASCPRASYAAEQTEAA